MQAALASKVAVALAAFVVAALIVVAVATGVKVLGLVPVMKVAERLARYCPAIGSLGFDFARVSKTATAVQVAERRGRASVRLTWRDGAHAVEPQSVCRWGGCLDEAGRRRQRRSVSVSGS